MQDFFAPLLFGGGGGIMKYLFQAGLFMRKQQIRQYLWVNGGLLLSAGGFWLYARFAAEYGSFCIFKLLFGGYCVFCGGTRALSALLKPDFAAVFRYNPYVGALALLGGGYDLLCLIRLIKKDPDPFRLPRRTGWWIFGAGVAFFIVRNLLLWVFHIDPIGDFLR